MTALPELVKQSSAVVKEVFGRLLGVHRGAAYSVVSVLLSVILKLTRNWSGKEPGIGTGADGCNAQYGC